MRLTLFCSVVDPLYLGTREHSKHHKVKNGWRAGFMGESHGKRDPRERHAATRFGHLSRTKDDVCDDDKVAVMQAPTYENLTLKRVEINAAKTELEADFGMI